MTPDKQPIPQQVKIGQEFYPYRDAPLVLLSLEAIPEPLSFDFANTYGISSRPVDLLVLHRPRDSYNVSLEDFEITSRKEKRVEIYYKNKSSRQHGYRPLDVSTQVPNEARILLSPLKLQVGFPVRRKIGERMATVTPWYEARAHFHHTSPIETNSYVMFRHFYPADTGPLATNRLEEITGLLEGLDVAIPVDDAPRRRMVFKFAWRENVERPKTTNS